MTATLLPCHRSEKEEAHKPHSGPGKAKRGREQAKKQAGAHIGHVKGWWVSWT